MTRPLPHSPSPPAAIAAEKPRTGTIAPQPRPVRGAYSESADAPSSRATVERQPRTADPSSPAVRGDFSIRFAAAGEHEAMHAAEAWCRARGFSVGVLQADAPRGILLGDVTIAKWRNLDAEDRTDLHGVMEASGRTWRTGPVTITIRRDAPSAVIEAFRSDPEPARAA